MNSLRFLLLISCLVIFQIKLHSQPKLWSSLPNGGSTEAGVLFEIGMDGSDFNVTHDYMQYNGQESTCKLLLASNNKLYGIAESGGLFGDGTFFEHDPVTESFTLLRSFDGGSFGGTPKEGIIQANNGKFYGMI